MKLKRYLGDGLYAGWDGFQIWLWCERDGQKHKIALEPEVMTAFEIYRRDIMKPIFDRNLPEQI